MRSHSMHPIGSHVSFEWGFLISSFFGGKSRDTFTIVYSRHGIELIDILHLLHAVIHRYPYPCFDWKSGCAGSLSQTQYILIFQMIRYTRFGACSVYAVCTCAVFFLSFLVLTAWCPPSHLHSFPFSCAVRPAVWGMTDDDGAYWYGVYGCEVGWCAMECGLWSNFV